MKSSFCRATHCYSRRDASPGADAAQPANQSSADLDEEAGEVAQLVGGVRLRERPPHARKRPVLHDLVHISAHACAKTQPRILTRKHEMLHFQGSGSFKG